MLNKSRGLTETPNNCRKFSKGTVNVSGRPRKTTFKSKGTAFSLGSGHHGDVKKLGQDTRNDGEHCPKWRWGNRLKKSRGKVTGNHHVKKGSSSRCGTDLKNRGRKNSAKNKGPTDSEPKHGQQGRKKKTEYSG